MSWPKAAGGIRERRRRLTDQHRDGVLIFRARDAHIGVQHLGRIELGLRLFDVGLRRETADMPVGRQLQRMRIGFDRLVEKPLLGILRTQVNIVERQLGMKAEARRRQIGRGCLGLLPRRLDRATYAAPEIDLVIKIDGHLEIAQRRRIRKRNIGLMRGIADVGGAGAGRNAGEFGGARHADQGARLYETRLGFFQALVGVAQLLLEPVELAIAEDFPPLATRERIARRRAYPDASGFRIGRGCGFLELRRNWHCRLDVVGPHHAARQ